MKKEKKKAEKEAENSPDLFMSKDRTQSNTKTIIHSESGLMIGTKKYYQTSEELETCVNDYFLECEEKKKPATMPGLARFLGFNSRMALWNYEHLESHKEFHEVLERAKNRFHEQLEEILLNGKNNPAGAIFLGKNYGYHDKIEIDTKGQYITQMIPVPAEDPKLKTIKLDENNSEAV
jgi:hypothetical protein